MVKWIRKTYQLDSNDEICISWDAYIINKGGVSQNDTPQTSVYLIPKKKGIKLSKEHCYKVAVYWGKDCRLLLKENTPRLIQFLEKVHSDPSIAPFGRVDCGEKSLNIRFTVSADHTSLKACFPGESGTGFCFWCDCNKETSAKIPTPRIKDNDIGKNSLFKIYRINIKPCLLHLKKTAHRAPS
jgi:hypothetical protein